MTKRVSIKGQGAEIFFDEGKGPAEEAEHSSPAESSEDPRKEETVDEAGAARVPESVPPSKHASKVAGQQASMHAGKHATMPPSMLPGLSREAAGTLSATTKRRLRSLLEREHLAHNSYRYNEEELAAVRDIIYELEVR